MTAIARIAVTGTASSECDADTVITPVIVPGLAANRISGAIGDPGCGEAPCPSLASPGVAVIMPAPIHTRTPPPAHANAFSETPKACRIVVPATAATSNMAVIATTADTASRRLVAGGLAPSLRMKIVAHMAGLTSARMVTTA